MHPMRRLNRLVRQILHILLLYLSHLWCRARRAHRVQLRVNEEKWKLQHTTILLALGILGIRFVVQVVCIRTKKAMLLLAPEQA